MNNSHWNWRVVSLCLFTTSNGFCQQIRLPITQHMPGIFANSLVIIIIQFLFYKTVYVFLWHPTYWLVQLSCLLSVSWKNNKTPPDYARGHRDNKHHKLVKQNLQIVYRHTISQRMNEWTNDWTNKRTHAHTHEQMKWKLWRSLIVNHTYCIF